MSNPIRKRARLLKKGRRSSTETPIPGFIQRLNQALQDERGRAFIHDRLVQTELPVIHF